MLGGYYGEGLTNYITKAGEDYNYFSLGNKWDNITGQQNLTDNDMFKLFIEPFLDDAVNSGKSINFSHDPRIYTDSILGMGWKYLQDNYGLTRLVENGGLWIAK